MAAAVMGCAREWPCKWKPEFPAGIVDWETVLGIYFPCL